MRFTTSYAELQKQLHAAGDYGVSGHKHADRIIGLAKQMGSTEVMDYGCGQQTLQRALPFPITNYDPFIAGCDSDPDAHDLVVCGDVLEHIEPECLGDVLLHLRSKTKKACFVDIACRPAKKQLADGRNAHLIQQSPSWWLHQLMSLFEPVFYQTYEGGFVGVFVPKGASTP